LICCFQGEAANISSLLLPTPPKLIIHHILLFLLAAPESFVGISCAVIRYSNGHCKKLPNITKYIKQHLELWGKYVYYKNKIDHDVWKNICNMRRWNGRFEKTAQEWKQER